MKRSCYCAEVCDGEFNKKHMGVTLFSVQFCVHEKMLNLLCDKGTKFVLRCWGLLLENFRAMGTTFEKSQKPMTL